MRKRSEAAPARTGDLEVEEASSQLAQALKDAEDVDDPSFGDLPRARPMHAGFDRVVTKVFVAEEDFEATYDKLVGLLRSLEGRGATEKAFWRDSLARAADGHHLATRLYTTAQKVLSNWEADNGVVCATMRERAYRELQLEKEQNKRNKTITDKDVDDRSMLIYPKDFPRYQKQREEYQLMTKNLEMMIKSFDHLNSNLRALIQGTQTAVY